MKSALLQMVIPDWQISWDTKQIAEEIPGFEFKGPGWYSKNGSWMLIVPTDTQDVFAIQVFYDRDPRPGFGALASLLVRAQPEEYQERERRPIRAGGYIVLLIGMVVLMPLSIWISSKLGYWGMSINIILGMIWWMAIRWAGKPKSKESNKT